MTVAYMTQVTRVLKVLVTAPAYWGMEEEGANISMREQAKYALLDISQPDLSPAKKIACLNAFVETSRDIVGENPGDETLEVILDFVTEAACAILGVNDGGLLGGAIFASLQWPQEGV